MGKDQGDDFRDGKVTLPVILAYARGSDADRRFWRPAMSGERAGDADLAHAFGLLKSTEALAETLDRARHSGPRGIDELDSFAASAAPPAMVATARCAESGRAPLMEK